MFAPKVYYQIHQRPLKKQSLKKQTAHNLERKLFQDEDRDSQHHKQIHKIASVRTIQPITNKLIRDRKSPAYPTSNKQGHNLVGKHRRKQSYLGSQGNPESQYESFIKSPPLTINKYYFESPLSLKDFYARIQKQLVGILQIIKKETKQANQKVRKAKQQINQQKIQYFKSLNKCTIQNSSQTIPECSQYTRIRQYTFQDTNDEEEQESNLLKIQQNKKQENEQKAEKTRRYLQERIRKLELDKQFQVDKLMKSQQKQKEDDSITEQQQIEYNKLLIRMLLLKQ